METEGEKEMDKSPTRIVDSFYVSLRKDTPIKSNFKEIWILDVTVNVSDM